MTSFSKLALVATLLAFIVVMLGAYTRLKDAGLGCPDWPGCYGQLVVPQSESALQKALARFPNQTVEAQKAWPEMVHRYAVGVLSLFVLIIFFQAFSKARLLLLAIVSLFIFQAALGMWTVTLRLWPVIVTLHLLCGMAVLSLLGLLCIKLQGVKKISVQDKTLRYFAIVCLSLVFIQIALGGWTSSNYAALACSDFPYCEGEWIPPLDFTHAFNLLAETNTAKMTIQFMHRLGFFITSIALLGFALYIRLTQSMRLIRRFGVALVVLLITQMTLGIFNVVAHLPLAVAVAHNAVAATLLLTLVSLNYLLSDEEAHG